MTKIAFRTAFILLLVALFATPSFAQYPGCQVCGNGGGQTDAALFCVDAQGWGWETCEVRMRGTVAFCRAGGVGCYSMELRG